MRSSLLLIPALVTAAACAKEPAPASAPAPAVRAPEPVAPPVGAYSEKLLDDVAQLATGHPLDPAKRTATLEALRAGTTTVDAFLEELVKTDDFASVVVPRVLLGELDFGPVNFRMWSLQNKVVDGQTIAFYRKPCDVKDTTEVVPWWDRTTKVRICNADYQPDTLTTKSGDSCSSIMARDSAECGCGPQLVNCVRDQAQSEQVFNSLYRETTGTIAHIVSSDQPFKDVFTTTYSSRDRMTEYIRMRDMLYAGKISKIPDLSKWPEQPVWAPRGEFWPGSQSGILTTKQYLYVSCGPRDRMRLIFARTWCTTPGSFGVTSELFSKLVADHTDIRFIGTGWQALAQQPGCTDCHARMDYGMQFFMGYPAITKSITPVPQQSRHGERGPIYMQDINDPRGDADLTPPALGELIVSQPEFGQCLSKLVGEHVLGSTASLEDRDQLLEKFKETGKMRSLFIAALRLYVQRNANAEQPTTPPVPTVTSRPVTEQVSVSPALAAQLVEHCADCHDDGAHPFLKGFEASHVLSRDVLITAANFVASGLMPANSVMPERAKDDMLTGMIADLAPDATWAQNAHAYWLGELAGSRVHHVGAVKERIAREAAYTLTPGDRARVVEDVLEGELETLTPALVSSVGQLAAASCRPLASTPDAYRDCLRRALRPESMFVK